MTAFNRIPNTGNIKKLGRMRRAFRFLSKIEAAEDKLLAPLRDKSVEGVTVPGAYKRVGAFALDGLFIALMFIVSIQLAKYLIGDSLYIVANIGFFVIVMGVPLYYALSQTLKGKTLGKAAFDIEVQSTKDNKLSLFQSLLRELTKMFLMPLAPVSLLIMLCSKKRQALHDFIATTQLTVKN